MASFRFEIAKWFYHRDRPRRFGHVYDQISPSFYIRYFLEYSVFIFNYSMIFAIDVLTNLFFRFFFNYFEEKF